MKAVCFTFSCFGHTYMDSPYPSSPSVGSGDPSEKGQAGCPITIVGHEGAGKGRG